MRFREVSLEKDKNIGTADTTVIDIAIKDIITELLIKVKAQNGATSNEDNPVARNVTKIELTDGGRAYWSLDGEQLVAFSRACIGRLPPEYRTEWDNTYPFQVFPLHFGRFYGDTEYSFDPTRFKNPQLKITHNLANVNAIAATAYATGSGRLDVIARIMEDAPSPSKMLACNQVTSYTSAGSGVKRIDMPVDWPYRFLLIRSFYADSPPGTNITNLKLDCDGGRFIPWDMEDDDILRMETSQFPPVDRVMEVLPTGAELKDLFMGNVYEVVICPNNTESFQAVLIYNQCSAYCQGYSAIGTALTGMKGAMLYSKGYQVENAFLIPFGRKDEPGTWFPAGDFGSIKLLLTEAVAAENSVAVMQEMPY